MNQKFTLTLRGVEIDSILNGLWLALQEFEVEKLSFSWGEANHLYRTIADQTARIGEHKATLQLDEWVLLSYYMKVATNLADEIGDSNANERYNATVNRIIEAIEDAHEEENLGF